MPVNDKHTQYSNAAPMWAKSRKVIAGQSAVHKAGEAFLPKLSGEKDAAYAARLARALFFNATSRTVYALAGMLFRKPPVLKVSPGAEKMLADVTQTGKSIKDLAKLAAVEALSIGRFGLLVDYPRAAAPGITVRDAERAGLRPKMATYPAEAIYNWRRTLVNNKFVLSLVVLQEWAEETDPDDEFKPICREQFRVLDLDPRELIEGAPNPLFGKYRQRVFKANDKGQFEREPQEEFYPQMAGQAMDEITFVVVGVDTTEPEVEEPPLADLVHANISHFQTTADVEHGAHKTALPQPWGTGIQYEPGMDDRGATLTPPSFVIGGDEIWLAPDLGAKFGMLEYTGQGLEALEARLLRKEAYMAVLGARMLEDQKKGVETVEVASLHRSGEQATLASQGDTLDAGIATALAWFDKWAGGSGEVTFQTNREFLPAGLSPQAITALVASWQAGALSELELFEALQRGGVVREDKEFELHDTEIRNAPPRLTAPAPGV